MAEFVLANKSSDFVVGEDDFAVLSVNPTKHGGFHYFYHEADKRLIKDFVLAVGKQVSTLATVTLIKKGNTFEPKIRLWKRFNRTKKVAEGPVKLSEETRHMKASVDTGDCVESLWKVIAFLQAFKDIDLPSNEFSVAEGADAALLKSIRSGKVDLKQLESIAEAISDSPETSQALAATDAGAVIARVVEHERHRSFIEKLDEEVRDAKSSEPKVQNLLRGQWWMFGGRFVGEARRRRLTVLDEIDIPLLRSDGTLHVVELKTPVAPKLIVEHRNHWIIGPELQEAIGQVTNYLRALDEQRSTILTELDVDCRRSFATIVVGHSAHTNHSAAEIAEVLRTHGSHLSRIDLMTYEELIEGARRSLRLEDDQLDEDS